MRSRLSITWSEIREQLSQNFNIPSQLLDKYDFLSPEVVYILAYIHSFIKKTFYPTKGHDKGLRDDGPVS